ncbi:MAG: LacI family DNA-binding transcriptional regulator [Spirochaetales bacterium]|nr:LacI family DNA-binding transcriptional regulator [Spirochaetales bacterium]
MRKKNITISDIAAKTGYSKTTVSFAFNWPNRISEEAVEKILACAKELGYHGSGDPDTSNRYKTICILVPETIEFGNVPLWAKSVYEIYEVCARRGFMMSMIDQSRMNDSFFVRSSVVDAFMAFTPELSTLLLDTARRRGIPVVSINIDINEGTEDEKSQARISNSLACLNMMMDLISDGNIREMAPEGSFSLLESNI